MNSEIYKTLKKYMPIIYVSTCSLCGCEVRVDIEKKSKQLICDKCRKVDNNE